MSNDINPIPWQWYLHRDSGRRLEVIYVDLETGVVDIHDEIGNVYEMEIQIWHASGMELSSAPADPTEELEEEELNDVASRDVAANPCEPTLMSVEIAPLAA